MSDEYLSARQLVSFVFVFVFEFVFEFVFVFVFEFVFVLVCVPTISYPGFLPERLLVSSGLTNVSCPRSSTHGILVR